MPQSQPFEHHAIYGGVTREVTDTLQHILLRNDQYLCTILCLKIDISSNSTGLVPPSVSTRRFISVEYSKAAEDITKEPIEPKGIIARILENPNR